MRRYEQIVNLLWVFLGIAICFYSVRLKLWGPVGGGSGLLPFLTGLSICFIGMLSLLSGLFKTYKGEYKQEFWGGPGAWKRIMSVIGSLCAMAFLMPILGFVVTSVLAMTFLLFSVEPRKWVTAIIISVTSSFAINALFSSLLQVSLPKGFWGF